MTEMKRLQRLNYMLFVLTVCLISVGCIDVTSSSNTTKEATMTPYELENNQPLSTFPPLINNTGNEKTIVICMPDIPQTLYPYHSQLYSERLILESIYEKEANTYTWQLFSSPPKVEVREIEVNQGDWFLNHETMLAEIFTGQELIMSQMVVTFTLRTDIRWSDGTLLTAADSIYAFELLADPQTSAEKDDVLLTSSYLSLNDFQIRWVGIPNYRTYNYGKHFTSPLPQHLWSSFSAKDLAIASISTREPVGWGPFMVEEWSKEGFLSLQRNPYYFRQPYPLLDRIVFRFGGNFYDRLADLTTKKECDISFEHNYREFYVSPEALDLISSFDVQSYPYPISWDHLDFVMKDWAGSPTILSDPLVRKAIAYAISPPSNGRLQRSYHFWHFEPLSTMRTNFTYPYFYDSIKAKAILEGSGWLDEDGDGLRERDGRELKLTLGFYGDFVMQESYISVIQEQLKEIGIELSLKSLTTDEFRAIVGKSSLNVSIDLLGYTTPIFIDHLCYLYLSSNEVGKFKDPQILGEPPQIQRITFFTGYNNSEYDMLCREAEYQVNVKEALVRYNLLEQKVAEELPFLPLYVRYGVVLTRFRIGNFAPENARVATWNVAEWTINDELPEN